VDDLPTTADCGCSEAAMGHNPASRMAHRGLVDHDLPMDVGDPSGQFLSTEGEHLSGRERATKTEHL